MSVINITVTAADPIEANARTPWPRDLSATVPTYNITVTYDAPDVAPSAPGFALEDSSGALLLESGDKLLLE